MAKEKRCKRCDAPLKDDDKYCPKCGAPCDSMAKEKKEEKRCKHCNAPVKDGDKFCPNCGAPPDEENYEPDDELPTPIYGTPPILRIKKRTSGSVIWSKINNLFS